MYVFMLTCMNGLWSQVYFYVYVYNIDFTVGVNVFLVHIITDDRLDMFYSSFICLLFVNVSLVVNRTVVCCQCLLDLPVIIHHSFTFI